MLVGIIIVIIIAAIVAAAIIVDAVRLLREYRDVVNQYNKCMDIIHGINANKYKKRGIFNAY